MLLPVREALCGEVHQRPHPLRQRSLQDLDAGVLAKRHGASVRDHAGIENPRGADGVRGVAVRPEKRSDVQGKLEILQSGRQGGSARGVFRARYGRGQEVDKYLTVY